MAVLSGYKVGGEWSREAAAQGLIIVRALYENRQDYVDAMLAQDGEVVIWQNNGGWLTPWPPSYCVIKSGTGRYFMYWAGTTSLNQAGSHIWGSVILPNFVGVFPLRRAGNAQTNWPWLAVADKQMGEILIRLGPVPSNSTYHLFGHSYGGAVASLCGEYLKYLNKPNVQLMTVGCPKVWSKGLLLGYPDVHYRLESEHDLVCSTPAPGDYTGFILGIVGDQVLNLAAKAAFAGWGDVGDAVLLTADGSGVKGSPDPIPRPMWVHNQFYDCHFTENYMGRIIQSWKVQVG